MSDECPPTTQHKAATLAAAMLRHVLPAAGSLRLEVTTDEYGTWLHLTYPPTESEQESPPAVPGGLTFVNSMALRWGHFGDNHWHTLWALLAPPPHTTEARGSAVGIHPKPVDEATQ